MMALVLGLQALGLSLVMTLVWAFTLKPGRSGWIDVTWSFALGAAGVVGALWPLGAPPSARQLLVTALVLAWSVRLGLHIAGRTAPGKDDPRYARLRADWGAGFAVRSWAFLQIQALVALLLAGAILLAAHEPTSALRAQDWLGAAIGVVAIGGEALADWQLRRFASSPANHSKVCEQGLWAASRHPNYFFEWLGWAAYAVIAIDPGGDYGWGWGALVGPAFMYWLLVYVSGIPPLEEHMLRSRGGAYVAYQARVNAFWPVPSRHRLQQER